MQILFDTNSNHMILVKTVDRLIVLRTGGGYK